jgi:hypothetical protein
MHNFRRLGIESQAVVLIGIVGEPSWEAQRFAEQTAATVLYYEDTRPDKTYVASIYFHLVAKYLTEHPQTEPIFFHDGDVIFRELPSFATMGGDVSYLSNTANYLGPDLYAPEAIEAMANAIGIPLDKVLTQPVGGAQYFIKTHDPQLWRTAELRSMTLYHYMQSPAFKALWGTKKRPDHWLAGMWSLLWTMYEREMPIETHPELDFTWPVYVAKTWRNTKILHNAGVQPTQKGQMFHKGSYVERSPFYEDLSFVSADYASYHYAQEVIAAAKVFNLGF